MDANSPKLQEIMLAYSVNIHIKPVSIVLYNSKDSMYMYVHIAYIIIF